MTSTLLPEQGGFNEKLDKLSFDFCKASCEKYKTLRGVYPNNRRATGKACSCGLEAAIRTLIIEEIIGEDRHDEEEYSSKVTKMQQRQRLGGTHGTK